MDTTVALVPVFKDLVKLFPCRSSYELSSAWVANKFTVFNRYLSSYSNNIGFTVYFKAFKTLMHDVATLKKVFIDGTVAPESYLAEFLSLSSRKHLLEKKRNKNYSPEVLCRSLTILENGNLVAI